MSRMQHQHYHQPLSYVEGSICMEWITFMAKIDRYQPNPGLSRKMFPAPNIYNRHITLAQLGTKVCLIDWPGGVLLL